MRTPNLNANEPPRSDPGSTSGPASGPPPPSSRRRRRGGAGFGDLIAQARRALEAGRRLAQAHLALLRAELGEIAAEVGKIAALGGGIFVIAVFAALLLTIGTTLFLGEWLFGSMGWGVLHGVLLSIALIVTIAFVIVEAPGRFNGYGLLAGLLAGLLTLLVFGTNLPRKLAEGAGQALLDRGANLDPAWAPVVAAMVFVSLLLGVLLLIVGWRVGAGRGGIYGLVGGLILGLPLGAFLGGLTWSLNGAVAAAIAVGLLTWPIVSLVALARSDFDVTQRFRRLWPRETYRAALETREFLERQMEEHMPTMGRRS
ncbi:MAG: phage holin family protein [Candidatus Limnocylindrales bacterium]